MPSDDADGWEWLLFVQQGIVTTAQAVEHKGRGHLKHQLGKERWRRVATGVIATTTKLAPGQQLWVAVLAAGQGAVVAGLSAAREGGLRLKSRRQTIDVVVKTQRQKLPKLFTHEMPGVRVHRSGVPDVMTGRPPRTSMPRSVVDAAQWALSDGEAHLIVAAVCQQRLVTPEEILEAAERQPRARRRGIVMRAAQDAQGGVTALSEIDFVRLCRREGLPKPDLQVRRKDADGRNRYLDAYWKAAKVHVEIDGAHHMDVKHWSADMLRQNEVWLEGDRVLRFPAFLVRSDPRRVVTQLRRALADARR